MNEKWVGFIPYALDIIQTWALMHTAAADGILYIKTAFRWLPQNTFLNWESFIFSMKSHGAVLFINMLIVYLGYAKVTSNYATIKRRLLIFDTIELGLIVIIQKLYSKLEGNDCNCSLITKE